jgi:hypothetical protein
VLTIYTWQSILATIGVKLVTRGIIMLDLQQIKDKLKERRLPLVARETGLHYNTVRKIAADADVDVSYLTVKRISDYLEGKDFLQSDLSRS